MIVKISEHNAELFRELYNEKDIYLVVNFLLAKHLKKELNKIKKIDNFKKNE